MSYVLDELKKLIDALPPMMPEQKRKYDLDLDILIYGSAFTDKDGNRVDPREVCAEWRDIPDTRGGRRG